MVGGGVSRSGRARGWRTSAVSMIPCREFDKSNLGICYPGGTMRTIATSTLITFFAAGMTCVRAVAQEGAIQDNSFLVEEAYNQEPGVVQYIAVREVPRHGGDWRFDFTQECPAPNLRHQLSYTVPVARVDGKGGLGDLAVNYRYQLLGDGDARLAVAPRLSVLLPTGDEDEGLGAGGTGVELNLPVSWIASDRVVAHWNLGGARPFDADGEGTAAADRDAVFAAQGLVWLARPTLNFVLEGRGGRGEGLGAGGRRAHGGGV